MMKKTAFSSEEKVLLKRIRIALSLQLGVTLNDQDACALLTLYYRRHTTLKATG